MANITPKSAQGYIELLKNKGNENFYRHIIAEGIKRTLHSNNVDVEVLELSKQFFALNRRIPTDDYFMIGKILRRAAHTLYRNFNRVDKKRQINSEFIQLV